MMIKIDLSYRILMDLITHMSLDTSQLKRLDHYATQIQTLAELLTDEAQSTPGANELTGMATSLVELATQLRRIRTSNVVRCPTTGSCQRCGRQLPLQILNEYDGFCRSCFKKTITESSEASEAEMSPKCKTLNCPYNPEANPRGRGYCLKCDPDWIPNYIGPTGH